MHLTIIFIIEDYFMIDQIDTRKIEEEAQYYIKRIVIFYLKQFQYKQEEGALLTVLLTFSASQSYCFLHIVYHIDMSCLAAGSRKIPPTKIPPTKIPPTKIPPTKIPPTKIPPTKIPPSENSTHVKFHPTIDWRVVYT